jgi:NitT/TauT family transport system permease protein
MLRHWAHCGEERSARGLTGHTTECSVEGTAMATSAIGTATRRFLADDSTVIIGGRILLGAAALLLWQFYPEIFGANPFWLSRPSLILAKAVELHHEGFLWPSIGVTVAETLIGLAAGCVVGVGVGIAIGVSRPMREIFEPFLLLANAFPKIAMAPLFMVWFGIGFLLKVAVAFSLVVVVMALSTYSGMRTVRQELVNNARTMGASEFQIFGKIVVPSIMPWLFAALRVSLTFALIGAVLGEFIAAQSGLGYMIDDGMANFNSEMIYLALFLLLILVLIANIAMAWIGRKLGIDEDSPTLAYNS